MSTYITRASLDVNGTEITDFKSITEKTSAMGKVVPLMYKTGSAALTERWSGEIDYVVPNDTTPFVFEGVFGATLNITYDSGDQSLYGGVRVIEVGDRVVDGENELIQKIHWMAETKNGATGA
jgi:hypothetical protein